MITHDLAIAPPLPRCVAHPRRPHRTRRRGRWRRDRRRLRLRLDATSSASGSIGLRTAPRPRDPHRARHRHRHRRDGRGVGISASSRADLLAELDRLGTNLLQVQPGPVVLRRGRQAARGRAGDDPPHRPGRVGGGRRPRERDRAPHRLHLDARDRRHQRGRGRARAAAHARRHRAPRDVPQRRDRAVSRRWCSAPRRRACSASRASTAHRVSARRPVVHRGRHPRPGPARARRSTAPRSSASRGRGDVRHRRVGVDGVRAHRRPTRSTRCATCSPATANPQAPNEVEVTRPSDALEARAATDDALTALLLGLGGVALLVGGIGIANVMVISVLERRTRDRRAPSPRRDASATSGCSSSSRRCCSPPRRRRRRGARRGRHGRVRRRARAGASRSRAPALAGGVGVALLIGALAGLYPAARAARLAPAEAVRAA